MTINEQIQEAKNLAIENFSGGEVMIQLIDKHLQDCTDEQKLRYWRICAMTGKVPVTDNINQNINEEWEKLFPTADTKTWIEKLELTKSKEDKKKSPLRPT